MLGQACRSRHGAVDLESFGLNTAKSLLGKHVNLHLKDGSVIVNVQVAEIQRDDFRRRVFVNCVPFHETHKLKIPLKSIAWAELLNLNLMQTSG